MGVTSGVASRRSAPISRQRQRWVQKKTHYDARYDGRHPGESSRGSRRSPIPPKEEVNFDRSPRVEEILLPNQESEIQWRRRSEIRMLEEEEEDIQDEDEEEMDDAINMEVVYMLRHTNINDEAYYDEGEDDENRQPPVRRVYRRQREAGSTVGGGDCSQGEQEADEVEENFFDDENITLANIKRQMRRQMRANDREISQLNEKMTEMMAQMGAMMQMMQRTAAVGPMPDLPTDPPNLRMPQVSGVRDTPEGGHETFNITRQPTPQNIASTSEPVTAAQLEGIITEKIKGHFDKHKKTKASGARRDEANSTFFSKVDKGKHVVYNVDKGKQQMQYEESLKQAYNPHPQPKLILGGNDKPRNFQGGGERPRQNMGTGDRTFPSLKDKMNKEYSFKRESVAKLFRQALKAGLELPECKRPEESKHTGDPNYCPYHRVVSHPIEDCYIFKDWLERKYQKGELTLSDNVLSHPRKESTRVVTSSSVPPDDERKDDKKPLEGVPGVKWKSPTEPVLNLKELSKVQTSSFKQHPNQASSSKPKKIKSSKKKTKLKKPKEKKTITQRIIDSLDEYYQTVRQSIKLTDFMSGLKEDESDPDLASQMEHVNLGSDSETTEKSPDTTMADSEENVLSNESESEKAAQLHKHEREKKQVGRKKASLTLPKAATVPKERKHISHLGSDTEEDDVTPTKSRGVRQPSAKRRKEVEYVNSDYDYESIFMNTVQCVFSRTIDSLSVSDSVLVVTRVPLQYFKEIIHREVHKVEELTTRYLPPLEKGTEPESILYSVGIQEEENRDWCYKFVDSEELFPTRLPRKMQEMFKNFKYGTAPQRLTLHYCGAIINVAEIPNMDMAVGHIIRNDIPPLKLVERLKGMFN
ncbi:hypothetical protein M5K25_024533 [Dendrobium thyrsiflorum]|uniref:Uncharacterized protein n=1 Tax=Dendrobium thyrsiflorum TaxID=117978 RepID=A0ABD0U284_DENTH